MARAKSTTDSSANLGFEANARRGSAFLQGEASLQVVSAAKDNFRKDDNVRWQPTGARRPERDDRSETTGAQRR